MKTVREILDFIWVNAEVYGKCPEGLNISPKEVKNQALLALSKVAVPKKMKWKKKYDALDERYIAGFNACQAKVKGKFK